MVGSKQLWNLREHVSRSWDLPRSGVAACRLLQEAGARVTVADRRNRTELSSGPRSVSTAITFRCDRRRASTNRRSIDADLVVISPGCSLSHGGARACPSARHQSDQ